MRFGNKVFERINQSSFRMLADIPPSVSSWTARYEAAIILGIGLVLALWLRLALWPFETADYRDFFGPWYDHIRANGGFRALATLEANYTVPYLYLLVIPATLFPTLPKLLAIKLIGISFDFVAGLLVYKLIRLRHPNGMLPLLATLLFFFSPTVVLNSALWGQVDIIYASGLLACLYYLQRQRPLPAIVAFSLAFSFKLQALFLLPLLIILLWRQHLVRWFHFLLIPLVYGVFNLPAWLAGRPLSALIFVYLGQANFYQDLTKNAPNLYQWLPNALYDLFYPAGLVFALAAGGLFVLVVHKSGVRLTNGRLLQISLISVLLLPYVLPKMHERYFFMADLLALMLVFYFPRLAVVPLLVIGTSFLSYLPFLFEYTVVPLATLAFLPTIAILITISHLLAAPLRDRFEVERYFWP